MLKINVSVVGAIPQDPYTYESPPNMGTTMEKLLVYLAMYVYTCMSTVNLLTLCPKKPQHCTVWPRSDM